MFTIINGKIIHPRIKQKIYPKLAKGHMPKINGIIVHQTDTKNAKQTFNSFAQGHSGTHFLIKKDGIIYQTASIAIPATEIFKHPDVSRKNPTEASTAKWN